MAQQTKAACNLCGKEYAKAGMTKHMSACLKKHIDEEKAHSKAKAVKYLHIVVTAPYKTAYWLHLFVRSDATLQTLDEFLRDLWLECCGHLSAFGYGGGYDEIGMKQKVGKILSPGTELDYQYDFGDTTELALKSQAEYSVPGDLFETVALLARNQEPDIPCSECGEPAVEVCGECMDWLCETCVEEHGCDEEMLLPVVNSPRTGQCGYTG